LKVAGHGRVAAIRMKKPPAFARGDPLWIRTDEDQEPG
jgi:hypothetical protein